MNMELLVATFAAAAAVTLGPWEQMTGRAMGTRALWPVGTLIHAAGFLWWVWHLPAAVGWWQVLGMWAALCVAVMGGVMAAMWWQWAAEVAASERAQRLLGLPMEALDE